MARMRPGRRRIALLSLILTNLIALVLTSEAGEKTWNQSVAALFIFGSSSVDSGNNDYIPTYVRGNFPPYGKDFPNHTATGRFTNGRLATDYIASYLGIKEFVPPFLDPTLSIEEMMTGVCFASAGSGLDPLTSQLRGVLSLQQQLENLKLYKSRLQHSIGENRTEQIINNSGFIISAGPDDYFFNYYGKASNQRRRQYTLSGYQNFLLQNAQQFIRDLVQVGARRIIYIGFPPLGCLPGVITISSVSPGRRCVESASSIAWDFNRMVQNNLSAMHIPGAKFYYFDTYKPLVDMIQNPTRYGFEEVNIGCCGSGLIEFGQLCNRLVRVCADDSKYVFFDALHPTQAAYYLIFRSGISLIHRVLANS